MAKTELTRKIEKALFKRLHKEGRKRFAFEVPIKSGYADCLTFKLDYKHNQLPIITVYEIKISYADFKSEHGHNFYGDENYYIVPKKLLEEIKNKEPYLPLGVGFYVYDEEKDKIRKVISSTRQSLKRRNLTIDDYFKLMDNVCRLWQNGTHNMYICGNRR